MHENRFPTLREFEELMRALKSPLPEDLRALIADPEHPARETIARSFPDFIFVHTADEVRAIQERTGKEIVPLFSTGAEQDSDVYGLEFVEAQPQICAVSEGALVASWPDFKTFVTWAEELLEPPPEEDLYLVD